MQCNFEKLNLLLDNKLTGTQKQEIEDHIKTCQKCGEDFAFLQEYKKYAGQISVEEIPKQIHDNVIRNIGKKKVSFGKITAVAAVLIFLITGIIFFNRQNPSNMFIAETSAPDILGAEEYPAEAPSEAMGQSNTGKSGQPDMEYDGKEVQPVETESDEIPDVAPELIPESTPYPSDDNEHNWVDEEPAYCCR